MRPGRGKRFKCVESRESEVESLAGQGDLSRGKQIVEAAENEAENGLQVDCSSYETGSFASRCSVRLIHEVVSKFDLYTIEIVKACGFAGILHFPAIKQFNRRFVMWLMSCVNCDLRTVIVGDEINIRFTKSDVGHVLGIPSAGKRVVDGRGSSRDAKQRVLDKFLGLKFKEQRSIKLVQEVIEREYSYPMSKAEEDTFRIAFVIFVVSNLLAPSAKYDYASIDYWNAIEDPGLLHTYDWSDYVIVKLVEAVRKLKHDMSCNIKFPLVTGCSIFLQVFYLDSLHIEGHMLNHNSFPRVREFPYEKIRDMIAADKNFTRFLCADSSIEACKLRDSIDCVYSWAHNYAEVREDSRAGCFMAIWEAVTAMVHLLNVPLESAGPIYVAVADFHQQINSGLFVTGSQVLRFLTVLVSIMIPYTRGFRYRQVYGSEPGSEILESSISSGVRILSDPTRLREKKHGSVSCVDSVICGQNCSGRCGASSSNCLDSNGVNWEVCPLKATDIGDQVERSFNSTIGSLDEMPHYFYVNQRVATAMTQFYGALRRLNAPRGFDLNSASGNDFSDRLGSIVCGSSSPRVVPAPWDMGFSWEDFSGRCSPMPDALQRLRDCERLVISHRVPKYIEVTGADFRSQVLGHCEMEVNLFDALIRALRDEDDKIYSAVGDLRWRHFFESDFMEGILSGSLDIKDPSICENLFLGQSSYDLSRCKLVFFPTLLQCYWACFAWAVEENVIYVFDPSSASPVPDSRVVVIERACYILKVVLETLSGVVFIGVPRRSRRPYTRMLTADDVRIARFNRSGMLCYMFCCCFDGASLNPKHCLVDTDCISGRLVRVISRLKHNDAKLPECLLDALG